jgi:predicted secreted protein
MEYILKNYIEVSKNEPLAQNPLANFIRTELPNSFSKEIPNSDKFHIKGSSGIGSWARIPWIGFLNKNISSTFKEGYYVAYLFKEDMSGFYLSLMFSVGNFRDFSSDELFKVSDELRKFIHTFPEIKVHSPMRLRKRNSGSYIASRYEKAAIYSIEYKHDDLPSEYELMRDLIILLRIYGFIYENNLVDSLIKKNLAEKPGNVVQYSSHEKSNVNNNDLNGIRHYDSLSYDEMLKKLQDIQNEIDYGGLEYENKVKKIIDNQKIIEGMIEDNQRNSKSEFVSSYLKFNQNPDITITDSSTFYRPVLELFSDGKTHRNSEIVEEIRNILPDDEKDSDIVNRRVLIPIKDFRDAGCLEGVRPILNCITEEGKKLLKINEVLLNRKVLRRYCPKFREYSYSRRKFEVNSDTHKNEIASEKEGFGRKFDHDNSKYGRIKSSESESIHNYNKHGQKFNIDINVPSTFYRPVLELFSDGKTHRNSEIVEEIRNFLPDDEKDSDIVNRRVLIPIKDFRDAGCLEGVRPILNCITEEGMKLLKLQEDVLDYNVLRRYCPKYRERYNVGNNKSNKLGDKDRLNKINIYDLESKPNKYYNFKKHSNKFKKLSKLLSDNNIEKLDDLYFLEENEFDNIIKNIINTHKKVLNKLIEKNSVDFEKLNILEKMFLFSKSFVKTYYKCGGDDLGYYRFNEIYIEEREPSDYKKIRTIIHELSHFLLSEILEQVLSEILDTDKTDILEAFIFYTLTDVNDFYLIDEYCACTVEGRFVSLGHQDYTSFKNSLHKPHLFNDEDLSIYGNTFARYIMLIMESFIDENLIKEIRKEGSKINYPNNDLKFETDEYLEWDDFKDTLGLIFKNKTNYTIEEAETIFEYSVEIKENNK